MKSVPVLGRSGPPRRQLIVGPSVKGCLVTVDSVFTLLCTASRQAGPLVSSICFSCLHPKVRLTQAKPRCLTSILSGFR